MKPSYVCGKKSFTERVTNIQLKDNAAWWNMHMNEVYEIGLKSS